jgi:phosphoglucomutase
MDSMAEYRRWLGFVGADERAELESIAGDPKEIEDRFYTELSFGTAGMRGVLGVGQNRMNAWNVRRVTRALAKVILSAPGQAERGVAIAYDSRRFSPEFALQTALVLAASGIKAMLFDSLRPVPVLSFAVRRLNAIAGVVITASHNPPAYNGYKVYWEDGGQIAPERAEAMQKMIDATSFLECPPMDEREAREKGLLVTIPSSLDDDYIQMVKGLCVNPELAREMGPSLKIVYTPLHGSGNVPVRRMLRELGFTQVFVVPEQEMPDPAFSTVAQPNPEDPAAFTLALKLREQLNADAVFGTDPDCDRVGIAVLDEAGKVHILSGNQIGCLLLDYVLSQKAERGELPKNAATVQSFVSTEMTRAIAAAYGVAVFDVPTGFKYIAEKIQWFEDTGAHTFVFGFEESFGYLSGTQVRDKDGVNACMLIAETAAFYKKRGMTLYDALMDLYKKYGYYLEKTMSHTLTGKDGQAHIAQIMNSLRVSPPAEVAGLKILAVRDYLEGTRTADGVASHIEFPTSNALYYELEGSAWTAIRPSGTEPKVKLYVGIREDTEPAAKTLLDCCCKAALSLMER